MWHRVIFILVLACFLTNCKHHHPEASAELKQAFKIQQEALTLNKKIDDRLLSATAIPVSLIEKKKTWLDSMVEIPGMDHDHTECNHDHKRLTYSISDEEMIVVQQSWYDSLIAIKVALDQALD